MAITADTVACAWFARVAHCNRAVRTFAPSPDTYPRK